MAIFTEALSNICHVLQRHCTIHFHYYR